ncbi:hypothetical protein [Luteolibacter arcticus]|nr:hypothetical protein [Luteolibacter arcticus]
MRDPYFAGILMEIEGLIHDRDRETVAGEGFAPKDSFVKSALRKAELAIGGKPPAKKPKGRDEEWIAALAAELVALSRQIQATDVPASHVGICFKAAQQSLDTRREMAGHPRGYLDYLAEFIPEARGLI